MRSADANTKTASPSWFETVTFAFSMGNRYMYRGKSKHKRHFIIYFVFHIRNGKASQVYLPNKFVLWDLKSAET